MSYQFIVCGGLAPDPLQTLEPVTTPSGPGLKNEMMLPAVFDPWAAHALYESAHLCRQLPGSSLKVVSLAPKAKLQQVMMTVAQKLPFELVALDGPSNGFSDAGATAEALAAAIAGLPGLDRSRLIVCGGWESATRGAGVVMPMLAEKLGIADVFLAVDEVHPREDGFLIKERVEGGKHMVSGIDGPPMVLGWATGTLPEPPNSPQVGMANMRAMMPALQKAAPVKLDNAALRFTEAALPKVVRETRIVKDLSSKEVARELAGWIKG
jgi:electron transfer flavoprotein beta subunit